MRAAGALLLCFSSVLTTGVATAVAQSDGASDSGGKNAGESANNWGGVPFWVWIIGVILVVALLAGFLYTTTRDKPAEREAPAPPRAPAPPAAAAAPPPTPAAGGTARDLAVATFPHITG